MKGTAVVVLNWNRKTDTLECLRSLAVQTCPGINIIMVDNGSVDDSVEAVKAQFPQVIVLANRENLGYAQGNNVGLRYALEMGADFVLLLNNDTVVAPHLIEKLEAAAAADDKIGVVGPKIYYHGTPNRIWSAGGRLVYADTVGQMRGYQQTDHGQFEAFETVDYVPGCAMFIRREALQIVGLLDAAYSPAYFEDTDWCLRAQRAGFKIVYTPQAVVWHKVSLSGGGEYNQLERYWLGYNSIVFVRRYANWFQQARYLVCAWASLPVACILRAPQGKSKAALVKGLGMWDALTGTRRQSFLPH